MARHVLWDILVLGHGRSSLDPLFVPYMKTDTDTQVSQYLWVNSSYWLNNQAVWANWPAREMSGTFKWYYLVQLAFWVQQILVIHIEARRKDHTQMLTHHIITCFLVTVAYVYRYTRVGNVVLCLMDVVDLLLPVSSSSSLNGGHELIYLCVTDCQNPALSWPRESLQHYLRRVRRNMVHCSPCYVFAAVLQYLLRCSRAKHHAIRMLFWYHIRGPSRHSSTS